MLGRARTGTRFIILAMIAPLVAACTTTTAPKGTTGATQPKAQMPISGSASSSGFFAPVTKYVEPSLADPCITAAANKYFLPEKVISAVDSRSGAAGGTDVILKVDLRSAVCSVTAKGTVRSVVDTTPMSADQAAANAAAAAAAANKAPAKKAEVVKASAKGKAKAK
ncbi:hypothetical protein [Paenochrobactrum glaciei]|uniref:Lipoprotein n=1 Tax=Paenochrobactrum glaciei TaxID=486407 RepID=A0ABP3R7Q1_9HYPH